MPLVEQCVAFYEEHFPDRYFLELIRTGRQDEEAYLPRRRGAGGSARPAGGGDQRCPLSRHQRFRRP
ncbi:hypothetical protein LNP74_01655 [Klebsiella pneumoniae subsp. pneumoniae]|nr:hypothetical protein [Klebsiella pneumoniae subsp. pneumoniae]